MKNFHHRNLNLVSTQFLIRHTPQDVQYSVVGFRDKNRDLLRE
jgi:myosin heavy subunit